MFEVNRDEKRPNIAINFQAQNGNRNYDISILQNIGSRKDLVDLTFLLCLVIILICQVVWELGSSGSQVLPKSHSILPSRLYF